MASSTTPASATAYRWEEPAEWQDYDAPDKSPVVYLHQNRKLYSPQKRTTAGTLYQKAQLRNWFNNIACTSGCIDNKNKGRTNNCTCLMEAAGVLDGETVASVVDYLYEFGLLEREEQRTLLKEWIKYAEASQMLLKRADRKKVYMLPGATLLICKDALCRLLGMGHDAWTSCVKISRENLPPTHGLKGQAGNRRDFELEAILSAYFCKQSELALPRATMIVRDFVRGEVQLELRNEDVDVRELPSHFTRKGMYNQLVQELGWKFHYDKKGRIIRKEPIADTEQQKTPSWFMFYNFWKRNYPKLVVATAREDVCNQCFIYANQHKYYVQRVKSAAATAALVAEELVEDDEENEDAAPPDDEEDDDEDGLRMLESETLVTKAARHVEMAQLQRSMYQRKKKEAIQTKHESPSNRVLCYVADYAQNMYLPNFASEQPGATYYYSPLSAFCFGIVDASVDKLTAWVYTEEDAKKGGNNVASLMLQHLQHKGIIELVSSSGEAFKEINFVMDNCCGQNKNRHVLRLLHIIVKRGIAKVVRAIFLVKGHTKNDCDRLFNTMKKEYRTTNCYTKEDLIASINHDSVEATMVPPETFRNWDALQNKHMAVPTGKVTSNHVFTVDINRNNGNSMAFQECDESPITEKTMVKPAFRNEDATFWNELQAAVIPSVGLQDIKWIEMHDKWGRYIPPDKKKEWRYYNEKPPPEVYKRVTKQSKASRQQRQDRTRTVQTDKSDKEKPTKKPKPKPPPEPGPTTGVI
jgi:hypothetical protein